jgi:hypothetical protein
MACVCEDGRYDQAASRRIRKVYSKNKNKNKNKILTQATPHTNKISNSPRYAGRGWE